MSERAIVPNYDFFPEVKILSNIKIYKDKSSIVEKIDDLLKESEFKTLVLDSYLSIDIADIKFITDGIEFSEIIDLNLYRLEDNEIENKFKDYLTDHPVNGKFASGHIIDMYEQNKIELALRKEFSGLRLIFGPGASNFVNDAVNIYVNTTFDKAWDRLIDSNKYLTEKRLKYIDFHLVEKHKHYNLCENDFIIDISIDNKMLSIIDYKEVINEIVKQPFRTVPLFQENIWGGGKWFQSRLGAPETNKKYSFLVSSILEEQYVNININGEILSIPGRDIINIEPLGLLGERNYYIYGSRTPIHLLIVDTIGGENSSLQVHPTAEYNQNQMNYPFGHHEGYYYIETTEQSKVLLGLKEDLKLREFSSALKTAQIKNKFEVANYVNSYDVEKFDYIYLPGGVVHAFCKESVCLEIDSSSTTTFKLWDWGRVDANGKPRQIDIDLGEKVIQENFSAPWVKANLFSREVLDNKEQEIYSDRIGTMSYCPMNVNKHWFNNELMIKNSSQMQIIVLVEGESAIICSPENIFNDFEIHYMETIYIPNDVKEVKITSPSQQRIAIVQIEKEGFSNNK